MFYKIYKNKSPFNLFKVILEKTSSYDMRNVDCIPSIKFKHRFFRNAFFPSAIIEWNKPDPNIQNVQSFGIFKSNILKFIRPTPRSFFNCYNHKGIKPMTQLCLGLSHLHFIVVVLNQLLAFFSTVPYLMIKNKTPEHPKQN